MRADYARFDEFLHGPDARRVEYIVDDICTRMPTYLGDDERPLIEKAYVRAQNDRVKLNGYLLRIVIEYHVGRKQKRW